MAAKALVVVESPAKAKTINKYLGTSYKVVASMGHVRDLPKSKLGVDIEDGFEPTYEVIASRKKVLTELKTAAKGASEIFVATDPDREGEAIGWHLAEELGSGNRKKIRRLMFNEITKKGVLAALEHPTPDQQADGRRAAGASGARPAGWLQDQPPAVGQGAPRVERGTRSIGDLEARVRSRTRDRAVRRQKSTWNIVARLAGPVPPEFDAKLLKKGGSNIKVGNEAQANAILADLRQASWVVTLSRDERAEKGSRSPLHHEQAPAGGALPRQKDDDDRPAAV